MSPSLQQRTDLREFRRPWLWLGAWGVGWLLCIGLSLMPPPPMPVDMALPEGDKLGHFLAYALLAAWAVWIFSGARSQRRAALALCALGVGLELAQAGFTADRMMDSRDGIADVLGVLAGWWLASRRAALLQRLDRFLFARG